MMLRIHMMPTSIMKIATPTMRWPIGSVQSTCMNSGFTRFTTSATPKGRAVRMMADS